MFFIRIAVQTGYFSTGSKTGSKTRYLNKKKIQIHPDSSG